MQFQVKEEWNARLRNDWEAWIQYNHPDTVDALSDDEMRELLKEENRPLDGSPRWLRCDDEEHNDWCGKLYDQL